MSVKAIVFDSIIGLSMIILFVLHAWNAPAIIVDLMPEICTGFNIFLQLHVLLLTLVLCERPDIDSSVQQRLRDQRVYLLLSSLFFTILYFK